MRRVTGVSRALLDAQRAYNLSLSQVLDFPGTTPPAPLWARVKRAATYARQLLRRAVCVAWNGRHEMYRAYSDDQVYHRCLTCGHRTAGWRVDRRDRRAFTVSKRRDR